MAQAAQHFPSRPRQVIWAVRLLYASLLLSFVATIPAYMEPLPPESRISSQSVWLLLVLAYAAWALMTLLIARGHNWARVATLAISIAGVSILAWDYHEYGIQPIYALILDVIGTTMAAVALYWLFTGRGAEWFSKERSEPDAL
jgi:hypothetical protein